jgi:hypothetical protein
MPREKDSREDTVSHAEEGSKIFKLRVKEVEDVRMRESVVEVG